ncbi:MAG: hypothetical protein PHU42_03040 [Patescibacteria group bacterium]|nr:hypothetical protein [Patescibacteria group bacterium]
MKDISQNILKKIKQQDVHPIPRWKFLLKNYGIWVIFSLVVLLGGLAVSVVIFMLTDRDWTIYRYLNKSFWEYLLISIPYFWFFLISIFLVFAWYDIKKTKTGYRYSFTKIGAISILSSIILGILFFYAGLGVRIDKIFADNLPYYQNIHHYSRPGVWQNPQSGLLVGEVEDIQGDGSFHIRDLENTNWLINCLNCIWSGGLVGEPGMLVRLVGQEMGDHIFQVSEIRPWKSKGDANIRYFLPNMPPPLR